MCVYRWLFLDLNAYFASVEQQENPELRGKPVGVVPVEADSSVLIAASYEAKRFGVTTLTRVGDAKRMCPELILVKAGHSNYTEYHKRIIQAVETVVPVDKVLSIDELRVRLLASEAEPEKTREIALRIKAAIRERVGEALSCSIGVSSNPFLAKIATEIEKPDGLVFLPPEELESRIGTWRLSQLPGINRRMSVRLNLAGIYTIPQLLSASERELRIAFGGVIGARWWHLLRGADLPDLETNRRTMSHEHVLPPEFRTKQGSYEVMLRLVEKISARLRRDASSARGISFQVRSQNERWESQVRMAPTHDTLKMIEILRERWPQNNIQNPNKVSVVLYDLMYDSQTTMSLFEPDNSGERLSVAVDKMNAKYGKHRVLPAGLVKAKETASEKIAFQKTTLFSEGLGDHAAA